MKQQAYQQTATPGAGISSEFPEEEMGKENNIPKPAKTTKAEEEDLWQEISDEMARRSSPVWRMWR